jgi:hypothetical protein
MPERWLDGERPAARCAYLPFGVDSIHASGFVRADFPEDEAVGMAV